MMRLYRLIDELQTQLSETRAHLAQVQWQLDHMVVHGPVTDVDTKKHRCRLEVGRDPETGDVIKGPWIPYGQIAGARKEHTPPSIGQQMTAFSPTGDPLQALCFAMTWSDQNQSPSDKPDEDVDVRGDTKLLVRKDEYKRQVGDDNFVHIQNKGGGVVHIKAATKIVVECADVELGGEGGTPVALCGGGCATRVKAV